MRVIHTTTEFTLHQSTDAVILTTLPHFNPPLSHLAWGNQAREPTRANDFLKARLKYPPVLPFNTIKEVWVHLRTEKEGAPHQGNKKFWLNTSIYPIEYGDLFEEEERRLREERQLALAKGLVDKPLEEKQDRVRSPELMSELDKGIGSVSPPIPEEEETLLLMADIGENIVVESKEDEEEANKLDEAAGVTPMDTSN